MSEIKQTFGLDASQAIDALRQLDSHYAQLQRRLNDVANTMQGFNRKVDVRPIESIQNSFNKIDTKSATREVNTLASTMQQQMPISAAQVGKLIVSLETLSRVVFTQFIVRGLSQIRNALNDAIDSSREFQKEISLIETIAGGIPFDRLAKDARSLSVNLGIDQAEIARGTYQALSNQVGDFGESLKFTEVAAKFAKATNSTVAESVDLLSGALKSYGLEAEDAETVASKFFIALDRGRLTSKELANTIGRVAPVAAELGISLSEVNAFLAASTVTGTKASEAITQLRGIMGAFLKPSDAMRKSIRQLGFESGEGILRAKGLAGAIEAVSKQSGNTSESLAEIFPNIRGLTGVVAGLRSQQALYNQTLRESENATGLLGAKFDIVARTDAAKFDKAINAIGTSFSEHFGDKVVKAVAQMSEFAGGAENLAGLGKLTAGSVESIAVAVTLLGSRALLASDRTGALLKNLRGIVNTPTGALGALAAGAPLAVDAGKAIGSKINELLKQQSTSAVQSAGQSYQAFADAERKKIGEARKTNDELVRLALDSAGQLGAAYNAAGESVQKSFENPAPAMNKFIADQQKLFESATKQRQALALATKEADSYQQAAKGIAAASGTVIEKFKPQVDEVRNLIQSMSSGNINTGDLAILIDKMAALRQTRADNAPILGPDLLGVSVNELSKAVVLLQEAKLKQAEIANSPSTQLLESMSRAAQENLGKAAVQSSAMATALSNGQTPAQAIAAAAAATEASYKNAAAAASGLGAQSVPVNRMFGGPMYRAAGGMARGTDTIPAMLSPGETVINAASSRRFFSQLQAINAGRAPVYRSDGGSVTNIGDTVFHINGADGPQATAREVRRMLNRDSRRRGQ